MKKLIDLFMKYYKKYKEIINYLIVGGLTTVLALAVYYGSVLTFLNPDDSIQLQIANILSWIAGVIFAYFTNRKFVFESKAENKLKEAGSFVLSRLITLFMDMAIMFFGVSVFHGNDKIMKLISQVVITISNYIFSKVFVFKKKNSKENNTVTEVQ
jgi:putative flippase GtrA